MSVSENLVKAVSNRDIQSIRDCLAANIVFDHNMTKGFAESLKYCLENGISEAELYERHDGRSLERAETMDAFSDLCGELGTNFSRERIDAIRGLGEKLHPLKHKVADEGRGSCCAENPKPDIALLPLAGFALGGAIVGGLALGLIFKKMLVGAVVGGIAGAVLGKKLGKSKR